MRGYSNKDRPVISPQELNSWANFADGNRPSSAAEPELQLWYRDPETGQRIRTPYEVPTGPEWSNGSAQTADEHGASGTNGGASASNAVTDVEYNNGEHMSDTQSKVEHGSGNTPNMNPYHDTTKVGSNGFNTADTHGRNGFNDGPRAASAVSDNFVTVDLNADAKDVADNGHEDVGAAAEVLAAAAKKAEEEAKHWAVINAWLAPSMALNDIGTRNDKEAQPKASVGSKGTLPHGKQNEKVASTDKKHIEPGINVAATPVDGPSVKTKDENFATDTNTGEAVVEADVSDNDHGANHKSYEESGLMASATQGAHTTNGNYHGATGLEGAAHGQDGISVDGMDDKETLSSILDAAIDQGAHIDDDSVTAAHVHGTSSDDGITITTGDVPAYPVDASRDGETVSVSDAVEALTRDLIDLAANAAVSPSVAPPRSDNSTPKSGAKPKFESGLGPNFSGSANESKKKETEAKGRDKRKAKAKHPGNDKDDSTDFESEDSKGNFPKFYEESPFAREPEEPRKPLVTEALDPAPPAPVPMAKIQQITGDPMLPRKASSVSMATIKSEYIPPHSKLAKFVDRAGPDGKCELYNPYDEDEVFDSDVLHRANSKSWVMSWIIDNTKENTRHVVNLKNSLNQFCDINTFTGKYMEPVKFPVTLMGRPERDNGFLDDRVLWRQFNHTSNYRIRAVRDMISRREDIKKHIIKNHEDAIERAEAQADIDHANNKYNNPRIIPKESVYLRPTKIEDVIDVCKIFNLEVVDGIQAARFDEVKPSWFVRIFKAVANQKLPFIVAVECDEEVDINLVPDGQKKMYREFLAYREQQKTGTEKVLGFAYMQDMDADEWDTDYEYTGKPVTAKLHFYVHSDHRRHKIGHAMLNRMVSFVSSRVWRTPGYKWEESGDEGIYADSAQDNSACVGKLVMETHYPDPNDGTLTWHKKFFGHAGKFDMMPIDKTQSRRYGHQVRWENGLMARKACNKV